MNEAIKTRRKTGRLSPSEQCRPLLYQRYLYRLFYNRDLYIIAYNSVKSNDGAETSGADGTSLHGFCEEWITELIASMRDESYQPRPNRTTMIPKSNGKMRKLSFPNGKDKLVQEAVPIILECIYEPTFSNQGALKSTLFRNKYFSSG